MLLDIPIFNQTTPLNCGPVALKMVSSFFGYNHSLEELEKLAGIKKDKGVYTIQLGIAARKLGLNALIFSKDLGFNEENLDLDFYKAHADTEKDKINLLFLEAKKEGVLAKEKILDLKDVFPHLNSKSVPIILVDWNIIANRPEKSYQGHFVVLTGYDEDNVYINVPDLSPNAKKDLKVKKEIFDKARKAKGTDEDIVIIFK